MERVSQVMGEKGLEIPLLLMQRYGLRPGTLVTMELGQDGIHILPALPKREDIEDQALLYTLVNLGDAVTVQAKPVENHWLVLVYGTLSDEPLGELVYSLSGQLKAEHSTSVAEMRQKAIEISEAK
jgi:hypothetical protein